MRINFQCDKCAIAYTMQMPDGIGTVGVTVDCPCGNTVQHDFETPPPEMGGMIWVVAEETVHGREKLPGQR